MVVPVEKIPSLLENELSIIWAAHDAVGLKGYMCLFTPAAQVPFRNKEPGLSFWFGKDDTKQAIEKILSVYNGGNLPNTSMLLNPIVHEKQKDGTYKPLGSGFSWATCLTLGVESMQKESATRIRQLGARASVFHRGENERAGLKVIAFCNEVQPVLPDAMAVKGCKELYDIADMSSPTYAPYYLLSGISYLSNNGLFHHPDIATLLPAGTLNNHKSIASSIKDMTIDAHKIFDAAYCWEAYERHHSLYEKFGANPEHVETNLGFFNLVARDVQLFDATGPMRKDADNIFEFLVPGLVPRGSVTMLAGAGGSGKSSLVHQLAVMASTDYKKGEEAPRWLGQRVAIEKCNGICIYFSGEDGAAILNARGAILDPEGRGQRIMFQRTDFGEGVSFSQYLKQLYKIPEVPLMVIDPARKFLVGDEEDSEAVNEFFEAIEEFAMKKNTAVVLVHHLQKRAQPQNAQEIFDMLRGSQVFVDRPRVIIGLYRDGANAVMGLAKNNIPPNFGMVLEERVFARDPETLGLIWLPGKDGIRGGMLSPEELEKLAKEAEKQGRR